MNDTCPECGALYNVSSRDIGRKLRCKKCSSSLTVTEAGLVIDDGKADADGAARPAPDESAEPTPKKRREKEAREPRAPRPNPLLMIGGVPTLLFGLGVFFVIVFTAFPIIGRAGTDRAAAYAERLQNDQEQEILALVPKDKKPADFSDAEKKNMEEKRPKIEAKYERQIAEAKLDAKRTELANRRDVWMEKWGLMFGFILLAFGCIGYLRTEQALILRIVAATVLTFMLMILFMLFGGCSFPR